MADDQSLEGYSGAAPLPGNAGHTIPPGGTRTGPPWENPGTPLERFLETARGVLATPTDLFGNMRREGGLRAPLVYGLIGTMIGVLAQFMFQFFLRSLAFTLPRMPSDPTATLGLGVLGGFAFVVYVVLLPVFVVAVLFIGAGIYHLLLLLLGGAHFPFETTFRVTAYSAGSTSLLNIIPFCGGFVGAVWQIVALIIGLAKAQETSTGKTAAAVLLPIAICCIVAILFLGALIALIMGTVKNGWTV